MENNNGTVQPKEAKQDLLYAMGIILIAAAGLKLLGGLLLTFFTGLAGKIFFNLGGLGLFTGLALNFKLLLSGALCLWAGLAGIKAQKTACRVFAVILALPALISFISAIAKGSGIFGALLSFALYGLYAWGTYKAFPF